MFPAHTCFSAVQNTVFLGLGVIDLWRSQNMWPFINITTGQFCTTHVPRHCHMVITSHATHSYVSLWHKDKLLSFWWVQCFPPEVILENDYRYRMPNKVVLYQFMIINCMWVALHFRWEKIVLDIKGGNSSKHAPAWTSAAFICIYIYLRYKVTVVIFLL